MILLIITLLSFDAPAQDTANRKENLLLRQRKMNFGDRVGFGTCSNRLLIVGGANIVILSGTALTLDKAWYSGYQRTSFHFFNDNGEWNQMDKFGHFWTAYNISRLSSLSWKWTGLSDKKSVLLGGLSALAYQSIIEIQDGFSSKWGFSTGDMIANLAGAAAFVSQDLQWKEQRIQIKFSYWPYHYSRDLLPRRDQLFGRPFMERILKDYNSQTYWVSGNLRSFFPGSALPGWLNMSIGYGADGMFGGYQNVWTDKSGTAFNRSDISRVRRFFIAPDVDLSKINTKLKWVHAVMQAFNVIKFPAPAVEFNSKGKLKLHPLKF